MWMERFISLQKPKPWIPQTPRENQNTCNLYAPEGTEPQASQPFDPEGPADEANGEREIHIQCWNEKTMKQEIQKTRKRRVKEMRKQRIGETRKWRTEQHAFAASAGSAGLAGGAAKARFSILHFLVSSILCFLVSSLLPHTSSAGPASPRTEESKKLTNQEVRLCLWFRSPRHQCWPC